MLLFHKMKILNILLRSLKTALIVLLFFFHATEASSQRLPFIHYDVDDGLSHERVAAIAQDHEGYMWFGTYNGLCRFDGQNITSFYPVDNLFQHIRTLCVDQKGQLWIGTTRRGVVLFDGNEFHPFPDSSIPMGQEVNVIMEDQAGNLWIGTNSGLFRYSDEGLRCFSDADGLFSNSIKSLHLDAHNHLWVGTLSGLYRLTETGSFDYQEEIGSGRISAITSVSDGTFWLGIDSAVYRWSDAGLEAIPVDSGSLGSAIHCFEVDQWDGLWAGTETGLFKYREGKLVRIDKDSGGASRDVLASFTDTEGNLWFGTETDVSMLRNEAFASWFSTSVRDVIASHQPNEVWAAGTEALYRLSSGKVVTEIDSTNYSNATVLCLTENVAGDLFLGTKGHGIFTYADGLFSHVDLTPPSGRKMAFISQILAEKEGALWAATHWCGVARLQGGITTEFSETDGLPDNRIRDILLDRRGTLWVGTLKGLACITEGKVRAFRANSGIPRHEILCLLEDDHGELWVGTDKGVYRSDGDQFKQVLPDAAFSKGHCRALAHKGNFLYIASAGGLYRANLITNEVQLYTQQDGLAGTSALPRAITIDENGSLWIGTTKGLTRLNPSLNIPNSRAPAVYITGVTLTREGAKLQNNTKLAAAQNNIQFDFVGLSYSLPEKVRFRYRLNMGKDTDWIESSDHYASYALLPPGHYTFEVIACNNDGVWSDEAASFHFTIIPPFWSTGWFYVSMALFLVIVVSGVYRLRERNMLKHTAELHKLRRYLANILDSMPSMLIGVDAAGLITEWNSEAGRKAGIAKPDAIGKPFYEILPWLNKEKDRNLRAIETQTVQMDSGQIRYEQGEKFYEDITIYPLIDSGNSGAVIRVDDVTQMFNLQEQFRQSQKMEAIGHLAGGIAHDFNNLLQGILGFSELAAEASEEPVRGYIHEAIKAANRAATLTKQLLAFSRQQMLQVKDIDLNTTVNDLMGMLQRLIGEHIQLDVQCTAIAHIVSADAGQVEQMLTNLTVNARDAMPSGGRITIRIEEVSFDEAFHHTHSWARPGLFHRLSVTDTGQGIEPELIDKIFNPFFTTKEVGKGTGLGLSTVYGLVEQHGGFIQVESVLKKGTTFNIYLPKVDRPFIAPIDQKGAAPTRHGNETILLAEDEEIVRLLTIETLEQAGYHVLAAKDGVEALELIHQSGDKIDLAVLDVVMPRVGGREVYEQIQDSHPTIRVLFSSGYSVDAIHSNFILEEGLDMIQKPWHRTEFINQIQRILNRTPSSPELK